MLTPPSVDSSPEKDFQQYRNGFLLFFLLMSYHYSIRTGISIKIKKEATDIQKGLSHKDIRWIIQ